MLNSAGRFWIVFLVLLSATFASFDRPADAGLGLDAQKARLAEGKELFTREWLPGDKRSHAGDGLGPVFNGRSCAECHMLGGVGGAGPRGVNDSIASAFLTRVLTEADVRMLAAELEATLKAERAREQTGKPAEIDPALRRATSNDEPTFKQPDRAKLAEVHPALRNESSFPLHRFSRVEGFDKWKHEKVRISSGGFGGLGFGGGFGGSGGFMGHKPVELKVSFITSERNTPPLFGAGLIDRIPDQVLKDLALKQAMAAAALPAPRIGDQKTVREVGCFPGIVEGPIPISGRVAMLKNGKIGRFGWKCSVATLHEFTLLACSSEIGLEVPGFPRAVPAWIKDYKAPGIDLTAQQCDSLVQFVASLPRPIVRAPQTAQHAAEADAGKKLFNRIGCAVCHRSKLGDVDGLYSDLLLHDMGQSLSGAGAYITNVEVAKTDGAVDSIPAANGFVPNSTKEAPPMFGATPREWRTPPLWGVRDSGPYLHDGCAETIGEAISLHGGEGLLAARAYADLNTRERLQLEIFLQSLAAPPSQP